MKDLAIPMTAVGVLMLGLSAIVNDQSISVAEGSPTDREIELRSLLTDVQAKLDDHTVRLMAIQDAIAVDQSVQQIEEPEAPAEPAEPVEQVEQRQARTLPEGYQIRMWTAEWCGICQEWKANELPQFSADDVVEHDFTANEAEGRRLGITRLPTFEVIRPDGTSTVRCVGARTAEQLRATVQKNAQQPVRQVRQQPQIIRDQWGSYRSNNTFHCGNARCRMCEARRARRQNDWQASIHVGQEPAPAEQIDEAIKQLDLGPTSVLTDIGCGDGRVLIRAAQTTGCKAIGIEIDPQRAKAARENVTDHGLDDDITIIVADARTVDLDEFGTTHVYTFLFAELLEELGPQLKGYPVAAVYHPIPGRSGTLTNGVYLYDA